MLGAQVRGALDGHGPADPVVGLADVDLGEAEPAQHVEAGVAELDGREAEHVAAELVAERVAVEGERELEGLGQLALDPIEDRPGEAASLELGVGDRRAAGQAARALAVADDVVDLAVGVAEPMQGAGHRLVDDLEVAAAGELLELDQREVGLDAGRVAVHDQADRAGRGDHGDLGVAVAVLLAELQGLVPSAAGRVEQVARADPRVDAHRRGVELLVLGLADRVGGPAMVADDPEHRLAVVGEAGEGPVLGRELGRGRVAGPGHHGGHGPADRDRFVGVIRHAADHEVGAEVGVAEPERAEGEAELGDLAARELRHQHRDLEHDRPQPAGVTDRLDVELAVLVDELHQVQRGQVAGRVVEEHVLGAGVARVDPTALRAGVPVVDRGVELQARVGAAPGRVGDLVPQLARTQGPADLAVDPSGQIPGPVLLDRVQEAIGQADRVVRVLAGDGRVGVGVPAGRVLLELDLARALLGQLNRPLDVVLGHLVATRGLDRAAQREVLARLEASALVTAARRERTRHVQARRGALVRADMAGADDLVEVLVADPRAGHQRGDLLLLDDLPVDVLLDVRVIDVDDDHLGCAPRGPAALDRAGGPVTDPQEAHQPARATAARERLALAPDLREVRAGARAVLEEPSLADPQIHDALLADQVVGDALDEAGVRLRVLVGVGRLEQLAGVRVAVVVTLGRPGDAVSPVQAGVEPLRAVGRGGLVGQHRDHLVEEDSRLLLVVEVVVLEAPVGPAAGHALEHLAAVGLADEALVGGQLRERLGVGLAALEPARHAVLGDATQASGDARATEVLLREDVDGDLRPAAGDLHVGGLEHDRAIGVGDPRATGFELDTFVGLLGGAGEQTRDLHRWDSQGGGRRERRRRGRERGRQRGRRRERKRPRARRSLSKTVSTLDSSLAPSPPCGGSDELEDRREVRPRRGLGDWPRVEGEQSEWRASGGPSRAREVAGAGGESDTPSVGAGGLPNHKM